MNSDHQTDGAGSAAAPQPDRWDDANALDQPRNMRPPPAPPSADNGVTQRYLPAALRRLFPFFYPRSLTTRLGILFALVAGLTFAAVGTYLYHTLSMQLAARDDAELIEKVGVIRLLISQTGSVDTIRHNPHMFLESAAGRNTLRMTVRTASGALLFDSTAGDPIAAAQSLVADSAGFLSQEQQQQQQQLPQLPASEAVPADAMPGPASVHELNSASGVQLRAVTAWCHLQQSGEQVEVTVARTNSDRMALLKVYRTEVLAAILSGALLAAALGYIVVRRGLRPVRRLAAQAASITAYRLETRLNAEEAPQELQELLQTFNEMLDRLQRSFSRLSRFSADIAHDLRTPLSNLMIQTQVALSQPRSLDEYQSLLVSNIEEYERLSRMAERMLFLARAEHASTLPVKIALDTASELKRIAEYFEGIAEDAGVRLRIDAKGTVSADGMLLRRAVGNLVTNAIRYTAPGGEILLCARCTHDAAVITVSNPGVGIDPVHLPKIFDRFYRADAARQDSASSAGLGLAIVKSIMSLHGGRAEVESVPNGITRFRLIFPTGSIILRCPD